MKKILSLVLVCVMLQGCSNEQESEASSGTLVNAPESATTFVPKINKGTGERIDISNNKSSDDSTQKETTEAKKQEQPVKDTKAQQPVEESEENTAKPTEPLVPRYKYNPEPKKKFENPGQVIYSSPTNGELENKLQKIVEMQHKMKEAEDKGYSYKIDSQGNVIVDEDPVVVSDQNGILYFSDPQKELK